jgi:hypothetical protein
LKHVHPLYLFLLINFTDLTYYYIYDTIIFNKTDETVFVQQQLIIVDLGGKAGSSEMKPILESRVFQRSLRALLKK